MCSFSSDLNHISHRILHNDNDFFTVHFLTRNGVLNMFLSNVFKLQLSHFPLSSVQLRTMLPPRRKRRKSRFGPFGITPLLLLAWWFTSVTGTLINKKVMKRFPFPIAFTSLHLVVGAALDFLILFSQQKSRGHLLSATSNLQHHLKSCTLNGVMFSMAKYLTYLSYRQVPVSLTHTVKV